jgi:methylated-DNA-[protein]-cysteine S-methyltransferase
MEIRSGSCRLGLWHVHVHWCGDTVHRVRFATTGIGSPVPEPFRQYCAGRPVDPATCPTVAIQDDSGSVYCRIYRAVRAIPYGGTATYGEIAKIAGTGPRVVGQAMARNITPLVIPCHRVVGAAGIGGFSPGIDLKIHLLELEQKGRRKILCRKRSM